MGSPWWDRHVKFPKYWHLEALAGIAAVFVAGMQLAARRHWLCLGTLVLGLFWLALAYRSLRRRE